MQRSGLDIYVNGNRTMPVFVKIHSQAKGGALVEAQGRGVSRRALVPSTSTAVGAINPAPHRLSPRRSGRSRRPQEALGGTEDGRCAVKRKGRFCGPSG
jgi:hypothetical protein